MLNFRSLLAAVAATFVLTGAQANSAPHPAVGGGPKAQPGNAPPALAPEPSSRPAAPAAAPKQTEAETDSPSDHAAQADLSPYPLLLLGLVAMGLLLFRRTSQDD